MIANVIFSCNFEGTSLQVPLSDRQYMGEGGQDAVVHCELCWRIGGGRGRSHSWDIEQVGC